MTNQINALMELSPIEKLELIKELWESLPETPEGILTYSDAPNFTEAIEAYTEGSSKYRNTLDQLSQLETDRLRKAIKISRKDFEEGRYETYTPETIGGLFDKILVEGREEMGLNG